MRSLRMIRSRGAVAAVLALALVLWVAACEDIGGTDTSADDETTTIVETETTVPAETTDTTVPAETTEAPTTTEVPSTTEAPATTAPPPASTTTSLSTAETVVGGGLIEAMGYIEDVWVDGGVRYLSIDYVEMLTTEPEKTNAARAAGEIGPAETWDLDYFISNVNPLLREFRISDSVEIYTTFRDHMVDLDGTPCSWADFVGFWGPGPLPDGDTHLPSAPWIIRRDGNTVVWIFEQFIP